MEHVFISKPGTMRERWREAFPKAVVVESVATLIEAEMVWLDISYLEPAEIADALLALASKRSLVVVLSPTPSEAEAAQVMARGARGYSHLLVSADTLRDMSSVIGRGGIWLGSELMIRLLKISERVVSRDLGEVDLSELTSREFSVAEMVGRGASNREIGEELGITERTVKAHMSSIFEKLGVRDRVHLAITVLKSVSAASVS